MEKTDKIHYSWRMGVISKKVRKEIDRRTADFGLTFIQSRVIAYIDFHKDEDVFQKTIQDDLKLNKSSVTTLLSNLEKMGFIKREGVSYDQRLKKLVLTDKAKKYQEDIYNTISKVDEEAFSCLNEEELYELNIILDKVLEFTKKISKE